MAFVNWFIIALFPIFLTLSIIGFIKKKIAVGVTFLLLALFGVPLLYVVAAIAVGTLVS